MHSLKVCTDFNSCLKISAAYLGAIGIPYFLNYVRNPTQADNG